MRGKYSSEEINQYISDRLELPFEKIWDIFVQDCNSMKIPEVTLQWVHDFRNRYTTILATDNMDCFSRFTAPANKLDRYFDVISNSFDHGMFKEDNGGELFKYLAEEHGAKIDGCILIDDSKKVCDIFSGIGGRACFVTNKTPLDYWLDKLENVFLISN
jgi:FMN phosphatase YigB (HAD superfamily)